MTRVFAAIAAVVIAGGLFVGAAYFATGLALPFLLQHLWFARVFGSVAPFVAMVVAIVPAIVITTKRRHSP